MQQTLFEMTEDYALNGIWEKSEGFIKKKYPKPVDGEGYDEYNQFILDETRLEVAYRLRIIADRFEENANKRKCF